MANRSTSPDRPALRWLPPVAYAGSAIAAAGMASAFWSATSETWFVVAGLALMFGILALYLVIFVRVVQLSQAALGRARSRGGLSHIVRALRAGNHAGWLTLHHDTGDIGFFSFIGPAQDIYVPRHTVATVGREPDGSTRVTYLGQDIASFVVASKHNNLELWQMPAAEAHAHARTEIPAAVARVRAES